MRHRWLVLIAASALVLLACDASSLLSQFLPQKELEEVKQALETVAPTVQSVATSVAKFTPPPLPAATQVAPTKGAGASAGNPFSDAASKAKNAKKYRIEFAWIFGGMEKGKYAETPFIDFKGEVDGANTHFVSKGGLMAMLTGNEQGSLEIIDAGGKTYIKGMSLAGLTDPKQWYVTTDSSTTSSFAGFAKPDEFGDWTGSANTNDFKKVRSESLDGQSCDVYLYDVKSLQNATIMGLLGSAKDKSDFSAIDKGEMSFWLCGDGFVHKFLLDYQGHDAKDATQKAALKMTWHAWDFNNPTITVNAPQGAKPMPGK